jgi:hypothetical protein
MVGDEERLNVQHETLNPEKDLGQAAQRARGRRKDEVFDRK